MHIITVGCEMVDTFSSHLVREGGNTPLFSVPPKSSSPRADKDSVIPYSPTSPPPVSVEVVGRAWVLERYGRPVGERRVVRLSHGR